MAGRSEGCILPTAGWVHHLERQWQAPSAQRRRERAGERGSANDELVSELTGGRADGRGGNYDPKARESERGAACPHKATTIQGRAASKRVPVQSRVEDRVSE